MEMDRRKTAIEAINRERISAIIRTDDQTLAGKAMAAAVEGGFHIVEFTLTTPGAFELIASFSKSKDLLVGAGTVLSIEQAQHAVSAGACFLVSPMFDPNFVTEAHRLGVAAIPGALTPTEMEQAHRCGADFVKVFPEPAGGIQFFRAIRGPLPHLKLFPTAGVSAENVAEFLDAGCAGAGFVRTLFDPGDMANGNMDGIRRRAAAIVSAVEQWQHMRQ